MRCNAPDSMNTPATALIMAAIQSSMKLIKAGLDSIVIMDTVKAEIFAMCFLSGQMQMNSALTPGRPADETPRLSKESHPGDL